MRRNADVFLGFVFALAAGASCLSAQGPERLPSEPEQSSVPAPVEDALVRPAPDWQGELDLIADLLIDGKPLDARNRAEQLLAEEELPSNMASRARALRDKADARLVKSPADSRPASRIEISPGTRSGTRSGEKDTKSATAAQERSFKIREAALGSGFGQGVTGLLRISEQGLSFVPQGKAKEGWSIRWQNLAEAKSDTGLWDAPYPLVLVERGGHRRYISCLDKGGSYLPGAPLLSAIAEGRRK